MKSSQAKVSSSGSTVCNCFKYATVVKSKNKFDHKTRGLKLENYTCHVVILRLKKTHPFGWHDEFRGGYLSLFNKMPSFVGLSTIAHG